MNAHALAATTTREPETHPTTEEWITYCAVIQCAWDALDRAVRSEVTER